MIRSNVGEPRLCEIVPLGCKHSRVITPAFVDFAVRVEALHYTERPPTFPGVDDPDEPMRLFQSDEGHAHELAVEREWVATADRAAWTSRRAEKVTPDLLAEVLEVYEAQGIRALLDRTHYTERYARRLIARARKELGR